MGEFICNVKSAAPHIVPSFCSHKATRGTCLVEDVNNGVSTGEKDSEKQTNSSRISEIDVRAMMMPGDMWA